jgi:hypothetical protein
LTLDLDHDQLLCSGKNFWDGSARNSWRSTK